MHLTRLVLKDGTELGGFIMLWRPELGWMEIDEREKGKPARTRISFDDIASAVTENERVSINKIADQDEVARAREYLARGREFNWPSTPKERFKWEDVP